MIVLLIALLFRIYYVSFGSVQSKIKSVAGGRTATLQLYNSKGLIYDRNLAALSGNQFCYYLVINPRAFDRKNIDQFCLDTQYNYDSFIEKLDSESIFVVESYTKPENMQGVYAYDGVSRYALNPVCRHILGYLDNDGVVGLSGLEKAFNTELSKDISKTSVTYSANAVQGVISGLGISSENNEISLNGIVTTLDKKLSLFCEKVFKDHINCGSLVIMNCNNGEILTLSSTPEFNYNSINNYIEKGGSELVNNAISLQTVGSVFKIIVSACALSNGIGDFEYDCNGGIYVDGRCFYCQNETKHGKLDLESAFSKSCNSYFIALGQILGYDKLLETTQLFGCDSKINLCKGIYSSSGNLPKDSGNQSLANFSIGQGDLMLSPLQISRVTAVAANGGFLVNPNLYYGTYINGEISNKSEYEYKAQILNLQIADKLKEMCIKCVSDGTGQTAKPATGMAGGKTASAQTGKYSEDGKEILNNYFTGFYPADKPKYVITVFALDGKSGSETCAPVFKEICDFISEND